jgi:hypothetical protein
MASRSLLLRRQRSWARQAGKAVDAAGCLPAVIDNLRQPLSGPAQADFAARGGAEFLDAEFQNGRRHVARMRAVHSSTALAVNVFDHWNAADPAPLAEALGLPAPIRRIVFEPHLPTGLAGNPANPDILLEIGSGGLLAIECKFSEWLVPKRQRAGVFHERYFPPGRGAWHEAGLPACQTLADDMQAGREYFRYLDVRQLLKHALGLKGTQTEQIALLYLYFAWPGCLGDLHRVEIERLTGRIGPELALSTLTYQSLVLKTGVAPALDYRAYLESRYGLSGQESHAVDP